MEKYIEKDKKDIIYGLLLIVVAYTLAMELPYVGKSISQLLIPTIRLRNGAIYLSGLLPIIPWVYGYRYINRSGYFSSKLLVFLGLFFIVGPVISNSIEHTKIPVYALNSEARSIEITDSSMNIASTNGILNISFECRFENHKAIHDEVEVILDLPDSLDGIVNKTRLVIRTYDGLFGRNREVIRFERELEFVNGNDIEDLIDSRYYDDEYIIEIKVNEDIVKNIRNRTLGD